MKLNEKLLKISKYLEGCDSIHQYSHFVKGVYIVQAKIGHRFSPIFLKWIDDNEIEAVYLSSVLDDKFYTIVVKED